VLVRETAVVGKDNIDQRPLGRGLVFLQVLRAAAALAVATAHIPQIGTVLPFSPYGAVGVDVFFVISGFIMVHSSRRLYGTGDGWIIFLGRRVARIVPIYWLACLWMGAFYLANAGPGVPAVTWSWMLSSLSFVPFGDGATEPITGVGWTLNFEMFFYACFTGTLLWSAYRSALILTAAFIASALLWKTQVLVLPFSFWFRPIIIEFVFGIWLGIAYRRGLTLSPRICVAAILGGVVIIGLSAAAGYYASPDYDIGLRFIVWGIPSLLIVSGCALGPQPLKIGPILWVLILLGNASYCIYLLHPLLEYQFHQWVWGRLVGFSYRVLAFLMIHQDSRQDAAMAAIWIELVTSLIVVMIVSVALHTCLESPMTNYFRRRISWQSKSSTSPTAVLGSQELTC
jgi:exopolysaccharide production protein ExoZ